MKYLLMLFALVLISCGQSNHTNKNYQAQPVCVETSVRYQVVYNPYYGYYWTYVTVCTKYEYR